MTPAQTAMYFAEWGKLRDVLRAKGWKNADIEQQRHEVTRRALGVRKSSKDFTNADLDKVLARIAAEREPDNFDAQMALQDSPEKRRVAALEACNRACWEIYCHGGNNGFAQGEARERYIAGVARNVVKKPIEDCTAEELRIVWGILDQQLSRVRRKAQGASAGTATADAPFEGEGDPY